MQFARNRFYTIPQRTQVQEVGIYLKIKEKSKLTNIWINLNSRYTDQPSNFNLYNF